MEKQINLFHHLPKEVTSGAFLMWLFIFLEQDQTDQSARESFFETMILKPEDRGKKITELDAERTEAAGNSDIVLRFKLDGEPRTILFENRISSLMAVNGFKHLYKDLYRYVYIPQDNAEHKEVILAQKRGYGIMDNSLLLNSLKPLEPFSSIISHYCEYLEHNNLMDTGRQGNEIHLDNLYRLRAKYSRFTVR